MKVGANSSDQKLILQMHAEEVSAKQISTTLKIELSVVKSFIKAGKTNFQISKAVEAAEAKEEQTPEQKKSLIDKLTGK